MRTPSHGKRYRTSSVQVMVHNSYSLSQFVTVSVSLHSKRYLGDDKCGDFCVEDKLINKMSLAMYEHNPDSDSD